MIKILIVEDDKSISNLISINLSDEGYHCLCAYDGNEAANLLEKNIYDLVLLDVMLPQIDGYELLEYVLYMKIPVIFITAKTSTEDVIKGLKLGADDYIKKPFQIGEIIARVEALLRRTGKLESKILEILGIKIDLESRTVTKDGKIIELTVKEYELLIYLIQNKNIAIYRDKIYERVWQEEFTGQTRTLDTHIQRLRKKLNLENNIKTVFRIGYKFEV